MGLEDLNLNDTSSKDLGGYFLVTITDLDLATTYPIQFQYVYADGRTNKDWSAGKYFTTQGATVPSDPQLQVTDVIGGAGFITVKWSGNDANGNPIQNFDRVDIHISGASFGDGSKPAGSFKTAGTQTFTCAPGETPPTVKPDGTIVGSLTPGSYIVQLKVHSLNGSSSFFSDARIVEVTEVGEVIQDPTNPNGFSIDRILGGITVNWAGTYSNGTFTGFEAIKIYVGNSATATSGTYKEAGVMTGNNVKNSIVIPVDGTYLRYDLPVYIHAAAMNKNQVVGTLQQNVANDSLGAKTAIASDLANQIISNQKLVDSAVTEAKIATSAITETKIATDAVTSSKIIANAITADKITTSAITADKIATNAVTAGKILAGTIDVTKLAAGTISVNNLEAGTLSSTSYIRAGGSTGARIEMATSNSSGVPAGFYIYNSAGTAILSAPLTGGLSINGSGTFSGNLSAAGGSFTGSLNIGSYFSVSATGVLSATAGTIGGLNLAAAAIQNNSVESSSTFKLDSGGKARFGSYSGNAIIIDPSASVKGYYLYHSSDGGTNASDIFAVSTAGVLTATGVNLTGKITASDGAIGGWTIGPSSLYSGSTYLYSNGTISGAKIISGQIDIQGDNFSSASNDSEGTSGSGSLGSSNSFSSEYSRNGIKNLGINGISLVSANTAGVISSWYPYFDDSVDLGIKSGATYATYRWRNLRLTANAYFGGDGSTNSVSPSIDGTGALTKIFSTGQIYANSLGTGSGLAIHQIQGTGPTAGYLKVNTSTKRHKENINYIDSFGYLNKVTDMKPAFFNYKEGFGDTERIELGLIAEDLEDLGGFNSVLHYDHEGKIIGISYDKLTAILILAIKELKQKLDALGA